MSEQRSFVSMPPQQTRDGSTAVHCPSPPVAPVPLPQAGKGEAPRMMKREPRIPNDVVPGVDFGPPNDSFRLGERLGKGGQGAVHECTRTHTSNKYAVKIIDVEGLNFTKKHRENLRLEIRNMSELHHPRIVNMLCAFWERGCCFLVLDLARGGDLHGRIEHEVRNTRVPPFKGLGGCEVASRHVTQQLLDGIAYMHSKHVIHRDLKLENVLIRKTEKGPVCDLHDVKIGDLGLSKYVGPPASAEQLAPTIPVPGVSKMTKRLSVVGSPDFVAPEVIEQVYDERADLWSLGVMVYAMFCGMWPFKIKASDCQKPEVHKTVVATLRAPQSWLATSDEGRAFVEGLLTVNPDDRLSVEGCKAHPWLQDEARGAENNVSIPRDFPQAGEVVGVVKKISTTLGDAVDLVELKFWNGQKERHGGSGGESQTVFDLKPDELIIGVMQETRGQYLGNSLCFYTSHARTINLPGWSAQRQHRFVAPHGRQIVGLQFDASTLIGVYLEKLSGAGHGAIAQISGRVGHAVDRLTLVLRDGEVLDYGAGGGAECGPFVLQRDEYITVVEQGRRDAFLGNSIVFYTSAGNVIRLLGMQSAAGVRFSVPVGSQLCGLEFRGSDLETIFTCPASGEDSSRRRALRAR